MTRYELSRRRFLHSAAGIAALGAVGGLVRTQSAYAASPTLSADGLSARSMAMHIHASFSEGAASMEAHLQQAQQTGIDVIWWTEHDQRMSAHDYRQVVHFDGLTEWENGKKWTWKPGSSGSFSSSGGGIVATPVSPNDTGAAALEIHGTSAGSALATRSYDAVVQNALFRTSLDGQTIEIDVFPTSVGSNAYLAIVLTTSHRPAREGLPAGRYRLSYRVGGTGAPGSRTRSGTTGVVTLAAPLNQWTTLRLNPAEDMAAIWPWLDGRDAGLYGLCLQAVSRRKVLAAGVFDFLRFTRARSSGDLPLATQAELMGLYAPQFPAVTQHPGLELSGAPTHVGWYGGALTLPDYASRSWTASALVQLVHDSGGIASYNHPFGSGGHPPLPEAEQEEKRATVAANLLSTRASGADILEVGYRDRNGVDLSRHAAVWDSCSRNAIFLTGTGVSDDHAGINWLGQKLNFVTWAWAADSSQEALVDALRAGRSYFGDPAKFRGTLDLLVDGVAPMGSVTVSDALQRSLRVIAGGVPEGGSVDVVTGIADLAGPTVTDPGTATVQTIPAAAFSIGFVEVPVDTSAPAFARVVVRNTAGVVVALSNPVWMLRDLPPDGIPTPRQVGSSAS
ncbi:MAG: hypothetical protein M3467_01555 [Actinomycetota bacterium]|nr:hypothetical protein [Actinomycetota bacterium]